MVTSAARFPPGLAAAGVRQSVRATPSAAPSTLRTAAPLCRRGALPRALRAAQREVSAPVERDAADFFAVDKRPIVLFDGVCNMCNGGVNFCLDWDKQGSVRFAALQSDVGRALLQRCGRAPEDISSIVLVEEGGCYIKSEAVLRIGERMEMPLPVLTTLAFPLPLFFRDNVYDFVAANRYLVFGRTESCRLSDDRFADRFVN
eukprot:jgi/Tetstr1/458134/TSEL_044626.t1